MNINQHERYKIALYIIGQGGEVSKVSCYDEEGVEGWKWTYQGKEWIELGLWDEQPAIPDEMIEYVLATDKCYFLK